MLYQRGLLATRAGFPFSVVVAALVGIAASQLDRIFDAFHQADPGR